MDSRGACAWLVAMCASAHADGLAESRTIYLVHDGVMVRPGDDDAGAGTSTLVSHPVEIPPWAAPAEVWHATVACVSDIFSRFAVTVTDEDPGDAPHLEAVFGGAPELLGLERTIDGIAPFSADCGIMERSIVFAFTDVMTGDARYACLVMAHELGHAYGLDHELLATDPMTVARVTGAREFADQDVACGEDAARPCGLPGGTTCRATQNSYALLAARIGIAGSAPPPAVDGSTNTLTGGCAVAGHGNLVGALGALATLRRRRPRP
jgi:hypothetical protein